MMLHARKSLGMAMSMALLLSQTIALADQSSSTTVQMTNPLGSSSTSEEIRTDAGGTSASVTKSHVNELGMDNKTTTLHSQVGPNGAEVSKQKSELRSDFDGSLTKSKESETHSVNVFGDQAKTKSKSSTTVSPDGSSTKIKEEHSWDNR